MRCPRLGQVTDKRTSLDHKCADPRQPQASSGQAKDPITCLPEKVLTVPHGPFLTALQHLSWGGDGGVVWSTSCWSIQDLVSRETWVLNQLPLSQVNKAVSLTS